MAGSARFREVPQVPQGSAKVPQRFRKGSAKVPQDSAGFLKDLPSGRFRKVPQGSAGLRICLMARSAGFHEIPRRGCPGCPKFEREREHKLRERS